MVADLQITSFARFDEKRLRYLQDAYVLRVAYAGQTDLRGIAVAAAADGGLHAARSVLQDDGQLAAQHPALAACAVVDERLFEVHPFDEAARREIGQAEACGVAVRVIGDVQHANEPDVRSIPF